MQYWPNSQSTKAEPLKASVFFVNEGLPSLAGFQAQCHRFCTSIHHCPLNIYARLIISNITRR
eukprot:scaffold204594_cov17-Prasinocladus_malaysianus.AAC.1